MSDLASTVLVFPGASNCLESTEAAEIVTLVEGYLLRARRGELHGIAIVTSSTQFPHELAMRVEMADPMAMLATLAIAQRRLARLADPGIGPGETE